MSASLYTGKARSPLPPPAVPRPRLTVVPRAAGRAARLPFVTVVVVLLVTGLVGLLLLNTGMERGAYTVTALRKQAAALDIRKQALQVEVLELQNSQSVATRALRLGMVANSSPAFLDLRTGKVLGVSVPGSTANRFDIGGAVPSQVGRLAKVPPVAAGAGTSVGVVVVVPVVRTPTKKHDTAPTSRTRGR